MTKRIKIQKKLKHTWENIDNIYAQYYDGSNEYSDRALKVLYVVNNNLKKEEQDIFYLMGEYDSLRKVSEECNISYGTVRNVLKKIKCLSENIDNELIKEFKN